MIFDMPSHSQEQSSSAAGCDKQDSARLLSPQPPVKTKPTPQGGDVIDKIDFTADLRYTSDTSSPSPDDFFSSPPHAHTYEPLSTLRPKVHALFLNQFPTLSASDLEVISLNDGAYNRTLLITIFEPLPTLSFLSFAPLRALIAQCINTPWKNRRVVERFILRVPRSPDQSAYMPYEITTLAYLKRFRLSLIPEILAHDGSRDNALGSAYTLRKYIPGVPLTELWSKLNLAQKKSFTAWMAEFLLDLNKRKSATAGVISPDQLVARLKRPKTEKWPVPRAFVEMLDTGLGRAKTGPAATKQTTRAWMVEMCKRQSQWAEEAPGQPLYEHIWNGFVEVIEQMHRLEFLPDEDVFHFWKGEFEAKDFLVGIVDDQSVRVHGIMGWEGAGFVPRFVSTRPPVWLWNGEHSESELKGEYQGIVGDQLGDWEAPEYVLLRKMYRCLTWGVIAAEEEREAKGILRELEACIPRRRRMGH